MDDSRWHILRVKPGSEADVASQAHAEGLQVYVPHTVRVYFNRRLRKVISYQTPILPGFVFVKLVAPSCLQLKPQRAVFGFMRNADRSPAVLNQRSFDLLARMEVLLNEQSAIKSSPKYTVGQQLVVNFKNGSELSVVISEIRGERILAEIVGSHLRIDLSHKDVKAEAA